MRNQIGHFQHRSPGRRHRQEKDGKETQERQAEEAVTGYDRHPHRIPHELKLSPFFSQHASKNMLAHLAQLLLGLFFFGQFDFLWCR